MGLCIHYLSLNQLNGILHAKITPQSRGWNIVRKFIFSDDAK